MSVKIKLIAILLLVFSHNFFAKEHKHILVLHSYFPAQGWAYEANLGLRTAFQEELKIYTTLDIRYLDLRSEINPDKVERLRRELFESYGDGKDIDLIMAIDDYAWGFINNKEHVLFEDIPVIFCSAKNYDESIPPKRLFTGLNESLSFEENIHLIRDMLPNTQEVLFLCSENLPTGRGHLKEMDKLPSMINGVKINIWRDSTSFSLKKELARLPHNSVIFYGITNFIDDPALDMEINLHNWQFFQQYASVPIFTHNYNLLEKGVLGGYMIKAYDTGYEAAKMAIEFLNGKPLHLMPVRLMKSRYLGINYKVAKQFHISESQIPKNADIINFDSSFWVKNRGLLFMLILFYVLLIGFIILLLERRNDAKRRLQSLKAKIRDIEDRWRMNRASLNLMYKELQVPFNAIQGLNKMISDPAISKEETHQYLTLINENVTEIRHFYNEFGQILADTPESTDIVSRAFECNYVLKEIYEYALNLRNEKKLGDITISLNLSDTPSLQLTSDPLRIKQQLILILHYLFVDNAMGVVELGIEKNEKNIRFYIKQNTRLISREMLQKVRTQNLKEGHELKDLSQLVHVQQDMCKKLNGVFRLKLVDNKSLTFSIGFTE